jgi:hypothetical protein
MPTSRQRPQIGTPGTFHGVYRRQRSHFTPIAGCTSTLPKVISAAAHEPMQALHLFGRALLPIGAADLGEPARLRIALTRLAPRHAFLVTNGSAHGIMLSVIGAMRAERTTLIVRRDRSAPELREIEESHIRPEKVGGCDSA